MHETYSERPITKYGKAQDMMPLKSKAEADVIRDLKKYRINAIDRDPTSNSADFSLSGVKVKRSSTIFTSE